MKSETINIQQAFQDRRQYRVPFYQRTYVWNKENQWERLWSDIQEKTTERLENIKPVAHFMGAVVLAPQPRKGILGIEELSIIDGQQRLTTLQYILASLSILLREHNELALLSLVESCRWNSNAETMESPETDVFKLWPTFRDRETYRLATSAETIIQINNLYHEKHKSRAPIKNNKQSESSIDAIRFFYLQIKNWIEQKDYNVQLLLRRITESVLSDLKLVSITLSEDDDAQVIFETLNGHGAQLHATDLIRNFIFMQADRENDNAVVLYSSLWAQFEGDFWITEQTRGRLKRPRLDWFIQTVLQVEFREEIDISKLYSSYQRFAKDKSSATQLNILSSYARHYESLVSGNKKNSIGRFGKRISIWDASTTHSLALLVSTSALTDENKDKIFDIIVSYFVRRAVCGLTAKNYNRVFNQLIKRIANQELTFDMIYEDISSLEGKAARWPRDDEFEKEWIESEMHKARLDSSKIKSIMLELEMAMRSTRTEESSLLESEKLDVEHILPIHWFEHWPLSDGTYVNEDDLIRIDISNKELSPYLEKALQREKAKNTIGNLTLLHRGVNRSLQNFQFNQKRETIFAESNLHLNRELLRTEYWNEDQIRSRAGNLLRFAIKVWPGPAGASEKSWLIENTLSSSKAQTSVATFERNNNANFLNSSVSSWVVKNIIFPEGTMFRAEYKGRIFRGEVKDGVLVLFDGNEFSSPSAAATHVTGNAVNGWRFWECRFPGASDWVLIGTLR